MAELQRFVKCPRCKAYDVKPNPDSTGYSYVCTACGFRWEDGEVM